jgi:small-conductance mechanosensitive channel
MDWRTFLTLVDGILNRPLFTLSGRAVTAITLVVFFAIIVLSFWASSITQRAIDRAFKYRGMTDPGMIGITHRLTHYAVLAVGFGVALQTLGLDLGALFAAGAFFAVAIGFAMQNVAQNFVSGVILLTERTIKNGDVLEVEGDVVRVTRMGLRATVARTRDEEDIIIPNSILAQNSVTNYTLRDPLYRLKAAVGVTYSSDMAEVMRVLKEAAATVTSRVQDRPPQVLLTEFGDNSVNFEVQVWTNEPWHARQGLSALNEAIWWALKKADITIAFPQVDVHLDPPIVDSLHALRPTG